MCALYLYNEKRRSYALVFVANFHLRNGAILWRLNSNADPSSNSLRNSCGIMINYRYLFDEIEENANMLKTILLQHLRISDSSSLLPISYLYKYCILLYNIERNVLLYQYFHTYVMKIRHIIK